MSREPWFSAHGGRLLVEVKDGYLKAYAEPLDANGNTAGIFSYGLQGRPRAEVSDGVRTLVDEFVTEAERRSANSQASPE